MPFLCTLYTIKQHKGANVVTISDRASCVLLFQNIKTKHFQGGAKSSTNYFSYNKDGRGEVKLVRAGAIRSVTKRSSLETPFSTGADAFLLCFKASFIILLTTGRGVAVSSFLHNSVHLQVRRFWQTAFVFSPSPLTQCHNSHSGVLLDSCQRSDSLWRFACGDVSTTYRILYFLTHALQAPFPLFLRFFMKHFLSLAL